MVHTYVQVCTGTFYHLDIHSLGWSGGSGGGGAKSVQREGRECPDEKLGNGNGNGNRRSI